MSFDSQMLKTLVPLYYVLSKYHSYEIKNIESIPTQGRCLVAFNHSWATYDIFLLAMGIFIKTGRVPNALADSNFFKFEAVRELCKRLNMVEAGHKNAEELLNNEELVYVGPGGMKESLRSSTDRYKILWGHRTGMARLSINTQTPIVLAACPKADEVFEVETTFATDFIYKKFKLPFVKFRGIGKTPIPRPISLTHHLHAPIWPPKIDKDDPSYEKVMKEYHHTLVEAMQKLLDETKEL